MNVSTIPLLRTAATLALLHAPICWAADASGDAAVAYAECVSKMRKVTVDQVLALQPKSMAETLSMGFELSKKTCAAEHAKMMGFISHRPAEDIARIAKKVDDTTREMFDDHFVSTLSAIVEAIRRKGPSQSPGR